MFPGVMDRLAQSPYAGLQAKSNLMLPIASMGQQGTMKGSGNSTTTIPSDPMQSAIGGGLGLLGLGLSPMTGGLSNTMLGGLLGF